MEVNPTTQTSPWAERAPCIFEKYSKFEFLILSWDRNVIENAPLPSIRLGPTIRILGMINRLEPRVRTFCQIWFQGSGQPVISKVLEYKYIWFKKWGNYKHGIFQPYMLACQLPQSHWKQVPISVSVVENECDLATNNLRVTYNRLKEGEKKKKFAVCVKGLDFPSEDISVRLVEWIEMLDILGADKVSMVARWL